MTSRAVICTELTDPTTWKLVRREKPKPSAGEALVRITLRPIIPADLIGPELFCGHMGPNCVVTGSEGVGYVEEVGENVTKVAKGQRVVPFFTQFYEKGNGSWQDYAVYKEDEFLILPESVSDETAAQCCVNPWTAYGLLEDQKLSKGDYLLQGAAGSSLGRVVIQIAKHWGIKTINVVRRDDVTEELKMLGADEVINSSKEDVVARVKEITGGKMAAGAIDPVGGKATQAMASSVRDGGKVFVCGFLGSPGHSSTVGIFDLGRVDVKWWSGFRIIEEKTAPVLTAEISKMLEQGVLQLETGKTFNLEQFQEALLEDSKPGRVGKVLLSF